MATQTYSWRSKNTKEKGAQIDIIIDRADKMINVCEVKYCQGPYTLDKAEYDKLQNRMHAFANETGTRSGLYLTMITTEGLAEGMEKGIAEEHAAVLHNLGISEEEYKKILKAKAEQ